LTRFRMLFAFSILAVIATGLVACGGGGGSQSPQDVINQTFGSGHGKLTSADLNLTLKTNVTGPQAGTLDATLSGPFESQGATKPPKLDLSLKYDAKTQSGKSSSFDGALISTGDSAFVNYKGTDYQIDQTIFDQYKQQLAQSGSKQSQSKQSVGALLKQLGISSPQDLLTNLKDEGDADVEGTSTQHISGDLDVGKVVDSLKSALSNASALGSLGGIDTSKLPSSSQLDQVKNAVKSAHFDLYSGKDDHILRRLTVSIAVQQGANKLDLNFDVTLGKVNESQTITAPSGAKPFSALLQQLGVGPSSLGALGALGGGSVPGSGIVGKGTPTTPPSGVPSGTNAAQAQKYLNCVAKANSAADLQSCSSLAP
jgi:hypothetical protein